MEQERLSALDSASAGEKDEEAGEVALPPKTVAVVRKVLQ